MVNAATEAVKLLAEKGIKATLVDLHTIRPLDTDLVSKVAAKTGRILVCENGRYPGGDENHHRRVPGKDQPGEDGFRQCRRGIR